MQVDGCVDIQGNYQCWGMETDAWEDCPADMLQNEVGWGVGMAVP